MRARATASAGHVVLGHVDGVGEIVAARPRPARPRADRLMRYLVEKGSVTVDGISLTAFDLDAATRFRVAVIPHTAAVTTLGSQARRRARSTSRSTCWPSTSSGCSRPVSRDARDASGPVVTAGRPERLMRRRPSAARRRQAVRPAWAGASRRSLASTSTIGRGEFVTPARAERVRQVDAAADRRRAPRRRPGHGARSPAAHPAGARAGKQFGLVPQTPALLPWRTVAPQRPPARRGEHGRRAHADAAARRDRLPS